MDRRIFLKEAGAGALAALQFTDTRAEGEVTQGASRKNPWEDLNERGTKSTYWRIKTYLDSIPAIDTHEHLRPFDQLPGYVETDRGRGVNLYGLWRGSYVSRIAVITPWDAEIPFERWWGRAQHDFDNLHATDFYRYMWLAFRDLYNIDFDHITEVQAADLNRRIFDNYRSTDWLYDVIKRRAGIEIMITDPYWKRLAFQADYPFEFITFNVTNLIWGFHPSEYVKGNHHNMIWDPSFDSPFSYAQRRSVPLFSLDDYLELLDQMFVEAKKGDCICLKTTAAYARTLYFENVPKKRAARVFGRPRSALTPEEAKAFEDFIMWRLTELSAKHEMPFQIHTGDALIQDSNPMLLVNLIDGNPETKFELFHGGYPWVRETGAIGQKFGRHVWINGVWLPTISYTTAKRAFNEWLEVIPSNRI